MIYWWYIFFYSQLCFYFWLFYKIKVIVQLFYLYLCIIKLFSKRSHTLSVTSLSINWCDVAVWACTYSFNNDVCVLFEEQLWQSWCFKWIWSLPFHYFTIISLGWSLWIQFVSWVCDISVSGISPVPVVSPRLLRILHRLLRSFVLDEVSGQLLL